MEGLYASKKGEFKEFSIPMLIECESSDSGCNGGLMEYAFTWLKTNGCIMFDYDYPYIGRKSICRLDRSKCVDMKVTGYKKLWSSSSSLTPVDEDGIKEFLYQTGPLAFGLNADVLKTYSSGIIDLSSSQSGINHFVLLIGYGTDSKSGKDYWIALNSWGRSWGESGCFRIRRGNGTCGVNCHIITATVSF